METHKFFLSVGNASYSFLQSFMTMVILTSLTTKKHVDYAKTEAVSASISSIRSYHQISRTHKECLEGLGACPFLKTPATPLNASNSLHAGPVASISWRRENRCVSLKLVIVARLEAVWNCSDPNL